MIDSCRHFSAQREAKKRTTRGGKQQRAESRERERERGDEEDDERNDPRVFFKELGKLLNTNNNHPMVKQISLNNLSGRVPVN